MTGTTYRGALIGCGFFSHNHMNGWRDLPGAEIVAVCDRDEDRARAMAEKFGIAKAYADAGEMLAAETVDFVDIATTAASHRPLVELAVRHAKTVICQKPFAENLADAEAMVAAAQRTHKREVRTEARAMKAKRHEVRMRRIAELQALMWDTDPASLSDDAFKFSCSSGTSTRSAEGRWISQGSYGFPSVFVQI